MVKKAKSQPVLKLENVGYTYSGSSLEAVYGVSFSLEAHTINMLIGPNGSGKSTLLKVILGILPGKGQISFYSNDKKITRHQAHIGYVPQKRTIDTTIPITVNEFLTLTQKSCKRCVSDVEKEIVDVLNKVKAVDYRYKKLSDLSGGQLQRIILARALLHSPQILILDEPEAGIDIEGERFFYEVLQKLVKEEGVTALIASHEMEVVNQYADQVLCLNKTLVCAGSVGEALTEATFKKLYGVHSKPYNHIHKGHHHEH